MPYICSGAEQDCWSCTTAASMPSAACWSCQQTRSPAWTAAPTWQCQWWRILTPPGVASLSRAWWFSPNWGPYNSHHKIIFITNTINSIIIIIVISICYPNIESNIWSCLNQATKKNQAEGQWWPSSWPVRCWVGSSYSLSSSSLSHYHHHHQHHHRFSLDVNTNVWYWWVT